MPSEYSSEFITPSSGNTPDLNTSIEVSVSIYHITKEGDLPNDESGVLEARYEMYNLILWVFNQDNPPSTHAISHSATRGTSSTLLQRIAPYMY